MKEWTLLGESLPDAMVWLDTSGVIIYANEHAARLWPTLNVVGRELFSLMSLKASALAKSRWSETEVGATLHTHAQPIDARETLYEWRMSRRPEGAIVLIRDLSDAFSELNARKEALRRLYEESPIMLHSIDREGKIVRVSDLWLEKLGYTREEVLGRTSLSFLTPESQKLARATLPNFMETGSCQDVPYQFIASNGEILDVLLSATSERDPQGGVSRSFAVLLDVTEYRRVHEKLDHQNSLLAAFFETIPDATVIADPERLIIKTNPAFTHHFGYTSEEALGQQTRLIYDTSESYESSGEERVQEVQASQVSYVQRYQRKNGEVFPAETTAAAIYDKSGAHLGYLGIIRDITQRLDMLATIEEQRDRLQETNERLQDKNEELSRFAFLASHDLREPLRKMTLYSELLEMELKGKLQETELMYLTYIKSSGVRLQKMIQDLLEYTRMEHEAELDAQSFDTDTLIQRALENMSEVPKILRLPKTNLSFEGHPILLPQVLTNLLNNAIKYCDPSRPLEVEILVEAQGEMLRLSVTDNGQGIDPIYHEKIFELFQRLHGKNISGTGIGLAMCEQIIHLHGGQLGVKSEKGAGATFWFNIPCTRSRHARHDD